MPNELDVTTAHILAAAARIHHTLGTNLLESAYSAALAHELRIRGHRVHTQLALYVVYGDVHLDPAFRIDMLVDDGIVVELETVPALTAAHEAQLHSHVRLSRYRAGLFINFHASRFRDGVLRIVNHERR